MSLNHYLLIDGVSWPKALPELYRRGEPLNIEPLYSGTRFARLQDLGPILVQINRPSALAREWAKSSELQSVSSLLSSRCSMKEMSTHLRRFISPPNINGNKSLLHFAAPLVLHHWLSSYSPAALDQVLGPIERVQIKVPTHVWQPQAEPPVTRFVRQEAPAMWDEQFSVLGKNQLEALGLCHRWAFEERLYVWLLECNSQAFGAFDSEQISQWMTQVLDSGEAWGLITERGLNTWTVICASWGIDFATRPDSPYQYWLKAEPQYARLPADLRIAALGQYRQLNPTTKEMAHG